MDREALVERMAKAMFECDPAYGDSAGIQRIRFEDVIISNGPYWRHKAEVVIAAIESAGLKIMGREIETPQASSMQIAAKEFGAVPCKHLSQFDAKRLFRAAWDAAPTYTDKGEGE